jgi:hypothetical protein
MILVLAGLYVDANRKVASLQQDIVRLTASQVLLMVPEEQAENIANWLTKHPEQTQAIVASAGKDQAQSVVFGPGALAYGQHAAAKNLNRETAATAEMTEQEVVVSENAQGVKVVRLPNGGIRVTTRNDK